MGRKKKIANIPVEILEEKARIKPVTVEKVLDISETEDLSKYVVKKTSFAKITFSHNRGPYIVAFLDEATATYADMNAMDFKALNIKDVKIDKIPIWECGAKSPEEINALPKLDLKAEKIKADKLKEEKKAAKAEKMKATLAAKAMKPQPMGKPRKKRTTKQK